MQIKTNTIRNTSVLLFNKVCVCVCVHCIPCPFGWGDVRGKHRKETTEASLTMMFELQIEVKIVT